MGKLAAKINTYHKRGIIIPLLYTILLSPSFVTLRMKVSWPTSDMP